MEDYDDNEEDGAAGAPVAGTKRLGVSLGLKLRPWESCGTGRTDASEMSLIDFTDDSFSSTTTPSPLTETLPLDQDTLKVK